MRKFTLSEELRMVAEFLTRYSSVERFNRMCPEDIRSHQLESIKKLVDAAYHHTRFYRQKYDAAGIHPADIHTWEDFERLPTLSKDEVIANMRGMVVDRYQPDRLFLSRSSGSSGKFVNIYLDARMFIEQELQVIRMIRSFYPKYGPLDREVLIYTSEYPFRSIGGFYSVSYIHNLSSVQRMFDAIREARPTLVAVYPSILREIVRAYGDQCKTLGIKAILTNSEHSSQAERNVFAETFGCVVIDEYSSEELSSIACQCIHHKYHLVSDSSYIEILDPGHDTKLLPGQLGEVVGTCLINQAMPFIRYRQGDLGVMGEDACTCGNNTPVLEEISGRANSAFRKNGDEIPSGRVLDWTYSLVLDDELDIHEFQVIQQTLHDIEVYIVPGKAFDPDIHNRQVADSFIRTFGNGFRVNVINVPSIRKTAAGKHIPILSYV